MHSNLLDPNACVLIGLDWADREHAVCRLLPDGGTEHRQLEHTPEAIADWLAGLRKQFPGRPIRIALEQSRGALMNALRRFADLELELYPINPKQLARYRDAIHPSGAKSDPDDAQLLARFLQNHQEQLLPFVADDPETRRLAELSELRRKLVDDRKTLVQKLEGTLKLYFPQLLEWCAGKSRQPLLLAVLRRWPSLGDLKRAHPKTLRTFLAEHGLRNPDQQTEWIDNVRPATPLTEDASLIEPRAMYAQSLGRQIEELNEAIAKFEKQLDEATAAHPDHELFRSLPGAGDVLTPRLIVAMGSDRDRYQDAGDVQSKSGIAPITKQSGKTRLVLSRIACPKFLRQTFHEFADQARRWSDWSRAFYQMKRAAGMSHHAAVRALAFKWIRIIFRMWQTGTPYSEMKYQEQLTIRNSPVWNLLETTTETT